MWLMLAALAAGWFGGVLGRTAPFEALAQTQTLVRAGEMRLVDADGRTKALLTLIKGQPRLLLLDDRGEFRIVVGLSDAGRPEVQLKDETGRTRAEMSVTGKNAPALLMTDAAGGRRVGLTLDQRGQPSFLLRDETGRERLAVWQERGEQGLALAGADGRPRAGLVLSDRSGPSLGFYNEKSEPIWFAPPR
jgi:hypothetical protein